MTQATWSTSVRLIGGAAALLVSAFFIFAASSVYAATCTWTGEVSFSWNNAGNWSGCNGNVPGVAGGVGDDVIFSAADDSSANVDVNVDINNFTMESGYSGLVGNPAGANLNVSGNWTNYSGTAAFAAGSSTVILDGTNQTIYGATNFQSLTKSSSSSTLTLEDSVTNRVIGTLTLSGVDASNRLNIRSTSPGLAAFLNVTGATTTLNFLDVRDNHLIKGNSTELDPTNSANSGNTYLWFTPSSLGTGTLTSTMQIDTSSGTHVLGAGALFGSSAAGLGDLDSNGFEDYAVGSPGDNDSGTDRGAAYIHLSTNATGGFTLAKIADSTANGPTLSDSDQYGYSVAHIGNLNDSLAADVVVGAPFDDAGGTDRGAVHISFLTTAGAITSTVEINDTTANGPVLSDSDNFGISVTNLGDLNGDGVQDLAVGAMNDDAGGSNRGAVHILFMNSDGSVDSTVEINDLTTNGPTLADEDRFGYAVAGIGDLNGDGVPDLAVGADSDDGIGTDQGAVFIVFLNANGSVSSTVEINGSTTNGPTLSNSDQYGVSIASIGDLNADGVQDLAVGAWQDDADGTNRGAVHIHFMNTDGTIDSTVEINATTTNGPSLVDNGRYGLAVANIGDLGGDGRADLLVGVPNDPVTLSDQGSIQIHFFSATTTYSISGRFYDNNGDAVTSADQTVRVLVNGTSWSTDVTDASGDYVATLVPYAAGDVVTIFVDDSARDAAIVTLAAAANMTSMDLYQSRLTLRHENAGPITNANLDTGNNGDTDLTALYADSGGTTFTGVSGITTRIDTGKTWTPGGSVNLSYTIQIYGTLNAGSATITTSSDWDQSTGTFTAGTSTVVFSGTNQFLIGSTTFFNFSKTEGADNSANETLTIGAGTTQTVTGTLTLNGRDDNDLVSLVSNVSGTAFTIAMSGASSALGTIDYVRVQDTTISAVSGSTVSLPVIPNGGVNVSNTSGWFATTSNNNTTLTGGGGGGVASTTPTIALTKPVAGVVLKAGETAEVFWTIGGSGINFVELSYSRDAGVTKTLIATNLERSTPYVWHVPATLASSNILLTADGYDSGKSKLASASAAYTIEAASVTADTSEPFVEVTTDTENRRVSSGSGQFGLSPVTGLAQEISQVRTGWNVRGFSYSTVYFIDAGKVRRPFWDTNSYFTHASTWNDVVWVSDATLSTLPLGAPMLPKAGSVLLKIQSVPKVYWAEQGTDGTMALRWVPSEDTAIKLFGTQWADYVIDVEPTVFARYKIGADVAPTEVLNVSGLKTRQALAVLAR